MKKLTDWKVWRTRGRDTAPGADVVHGGNGNDFILAGAGDDILYGDAGDPPLAANDDDWREAA